MSNFIHSWKICVGLSWQDNCGAHNEEDTPDIIFTLTFDDNVLRGEIAYLSNLHAHDSIDTFGGVFQKTLKAALRSPSSRLLALYLTTPEDLCLIRSWNATSPVPTSANQGGPSLIDLFRVAAKRQGDKLAVTDGNLSMSYAVIDSRSDRLASWLRAQGFCREAVIGVVRYLFV